MIVIAIVVAYGKCMKALDDISIGKLTVLLDPKNEIMLDLTARLAVVDAVRVFDMGNSFNAFYVARHIRRQTPNLTHALERITVSRAFTCYQVKALVEKTHVSTSPLLIINLLTTFYDESVSVAESYRLVHLTMCRLRELSQGAAVIISLRQPRQAERAGLVDIVTKAADSRISWDMPETIVQPSLI